MPRRYTLFDKISLQFDAALKALIPSQDLTTQRTNPAQGLSESELTSAERRHTVGLMRVNHMGEVCAQALYQGQALTARLDHVKTQMETAIQEERDHLLWCQQRIQELNGHTSYLNPLWYTASFTLGAIAGLAGDRWSLGFVIETEKQVVAHLEGHLKKLVATDQKTQAILTQMSEDEARHAETAREAGGAELPRPVKQFMYWGAKCMTTLSYFL